jgi:hypothetical protein
LWKARESNYLKYLAYVAVRRGYGGGGVGCGREEGQAVVLAGEAVGGVHLAVAARAEGGLVGAADHARLGRLARGAENLHGSSEPIDHYTIIRVEGRGRRRRGRRLRLELWIDREGGEAVRFCRAGASPSPAGW